MKISTDGLIIKEQNIGEQDKLVTVLTKSSGVIRAFAKGAKNIKSSKCAGTSLLSFSRLEIYEGRDSYIINDAKSLEMFINLRKDIEAMSLAQYFCELAVAVCPQGIPADDFLKLILNALHLLCTGKKHHLLIKACLEMRLLALSGYMPDLIMCKECGAYESAQMVFVPKTGTLLCDNCHKKQNSAMHITNSKQQTAIHTGQFLLMDMGVTTALRHTIYAEQEKLFRFSLPERGLELLNSITETYMSYMLDKDFATLQFYKTIKQT